MSIEPKGVMTLRELVAAAAAALSSADVEQSSGRISDVPTLRTVRYYATHGLLSKPDAHRGRAALFGRRHLAELVAIKRLQASGETLEDIQRRLLGIPDDDLLTLANLPEGIPGVQDDEELEGSAPEAPERAQGSFWRSEPAVPSSHDEILEGSDDVEEDEEDVMWRGVPLGAGIVLMIEGVRRELGPDDLAAIGAAAEPLMHVLRARRLIKPGGE